MSVKNINKYFQNIFPAKLGNISPPGYIPPRGDISSITRLTGGYNKIIMAILLMGLINMIDLYKNIVINSGGFYISENNLFYLFIISLFGAFGAFGDDLKVNINKLCNNLFPAKPRDNFTVYLILGLSLTGLLMLLISGDLIILYLSLELYSLSVYLLVFKYGGGAKLSILYLILGGISSSLILLGIAIMYSNSGSLDLVIINMGGISSKILTLGLLFKVGSAPFQYWVIKVYSKTDLPILMYLTILPKFVFVYALALPGFANDKGVIYVCGILSLIVGSISALSLSAPPSGGDIFPQGGIYSASPESPQRGDLSFWDKLFYRIIYTGGVHFKTLLAYSSVYNVGFLLLAHTGGMSLQYLIIYGLNTLHLLLGYRLGGASWPGVGILKLTVIISVFSFIGFPPFAGFFAKINILFYSFFSQQLVGVFVIFAASAAAAFLYLKFLFLGKAGNNLLPKVKIPKASPPSEGGKGKGGYLYSIITLIISAYTLFSSFLTPLFEWAAH